MANNDGNVFVNNRDIVFSGVVNPDNIGKIIMAIRSIENEDSENEARLKNIAAHELFKPQCAERIAAVGYADMVAVTGDRHTAARYVKARIASERLNKLAGSYHIDAEKIGRFVICRGYRCIHHLLTVAVTLA